MKNYFVKFCLSTLLILPTICNGQIWNALDSFPGVPRYGVTVFSINGVGYVGATGGSGSNLYKDLYAYDGNSAQWTVKAQFPGTARRVGIGFALGGYGFAGLGWSGSFDYKDFYKYDPNSDTWSSASLYPGGAGRTTFNAATTTKGYVGGGANGISVSSYQSDWWEYDPIADTWYSLPNFPFGNRSGGVAFAIGCQVFAGLGHNGMVATNDFWSFNTQLREWVQVANFPGSARLHPSSFIINGRAIVGGGYQRGSGNELDDYYSYDPIANTWTTVPGFASGKRGISEGFEIGSVGYVVAGWDDMNVPLNDLWSYVDTSNCDTRLFDQISSCGPFYSTTYARQFDKSGIYFDSSGTGNCQTITTICVEIHETYNDTINIVACDSFVSPIGTFYTPGFYGDTLMTSEGCDSIVTYDFTLYKINTNISRSLSVLFAVEPNASYQWIECDKQIIIPGQTNQGILITENGNFAAIIYKNGCIDTTECYLVTDVGIENSNRNHFSIYPNPANEFINVKYNESLIIKYELFDINGRVVLEGDLNRKINISNLNMGSYILVLENKGERYYFKVLKN